MIILLIDIVHIVCIAHIWYYLPPLSIRLHIARCAILIIFFYIKLSDNALKRLRSNRPLWRLCLIISSEFCLAKPIWTPLSPTAAVESSALNYQSPRPARNCWWSFATPNCEETEAADLLSICVKVSYSWRGFVACQNTKLLDLEALELDSKCNLLRKSRSPSSQLPAQVPGSPRSAASVPTPSADVLGGFLAVFTVDGTSKTHGSASGRGMGPATGSASSSSGDCLCRAPGRVPRSPPPSPLAAMPVAAAQPATQPPSVGRYIVGDLGSRWCMSSPNFPAMVRRTLVCIDTALTLHLWEVRHGVWHSRITLDKRALHEAAWEGEVLVR